MAIRVLFVDDERNILNGLRRMLHPMRNEWAMEFADCGPAALEALAAQPFDVIVSDMRMPGMDGAELLGEVRRRHPNMIRVILSGYSDKEMILRSIGPAHQYLAKPCTTEKIKETIQSALVLGKLLKGEQLKEAVGRMDSLPSLPTLYQELTTIMESPSTTLADVGGIIAKDVGMTSQVLRLVNSAFFGLCQEVTDPTSAVSFLGLNMITSLVLSVEVFRQAEPGQLSQLGLGRLWQHSLGTATLARAIAMAESKNRSLADQAFTAGILHDTGRLILGVNFPARYAKVSGAAKNTREPVEEELTEFGVSHAEVGAYLLGIWGLPHPIIGALAFHHKPRQASLKIFSPLTAVHVAEFLEEELAGAAGDLDTDHLEEIGRAHRLPEWRELCQEKLSSEASGQ